MRVFITGGTGTISKYITDILAKRGHEIVLMKRTPLSEKNRPNVETVFCDRYNHEEFIRICKGLGKFDCVIDMITYKEKDAESTIEAFKGNTEHLIFCSTVDAYKKDGKSYPIKENFCRESSRSFEYAYQKVICENMLMDAEKRGDFKLTIIRPALTYNDGGCPVIHALGWGSYHLDRLKKGKKIIIHGDGINIWTATHGRDVAMAFANAACNNMAYGKSYNVMGDEYMSFEQYWNTIAEAMGVPRPDYVYITTDLLYKIAPIHAEWCKENFKFNNMFDNSEAKLDLGFKYTMTWKEGIKKCIDFLEKNKGIEDSDSEQYAFYDRIIEEYDKLCINMANALKPLGPI